MTRLRIEQDEFPSFVRDVTGRFGVEEVVKRTAIPIEAIDRWQRGGNHASTREKEALRWFCVYQRAFDIVKKHRLPMPLYDLVAINDRERLPLGVPLSSFSHISSVAGLIELPTRIAGLRLNFPFGLAACNASIPRTGSLSDSDLLLDCAAQGYDLLTYKTVRSESRRPHTPPNWAFVRSSELEKITPPFTEPVTGDLEYLPTDPTRRIMANSFGNPSAAPDVWQPDVARIKRSLRPGQILVVSVMGTAIEESRDSLVDDFARVAWLAKAAGADIVEANFSCPNIPREPASTVFKQPDLARDIAEKMREALDDTPLFVKIGYLDTEPLVDFVRAVRPFIQGIVAINTIPVPIISPSGDWFFSGDGRQCAGISGASIRPWARKVVADLVAIRAREGAGRDLAIIALGGVLEAADVYDYLALGADAVESCTGAFLNPNLAIETRQPNLAMPGDHLRGNATKEVRDISGPEQTSAAHLKGNSEALAQNRTALREIFRPLLQQEGTAAKVRQRGPTTIDKASLERNRTALREIFRPLLQHDDAHITGTTERESERQ